MPATGRSVTLCLCVWPGSVRHEAGPALPAASLAVPAGSAPVCPPGSPLIGADHEAQPAPSLRVLCILCPVCGTRLSSVLSVGTSYPLPMPSFTIEGRQLR